MEQTQEMLLESEANTDSRAESTQPESLRGETAAPETPTTESAPAQPDTVPPPDALSDEEKAQMVHQAGSKLRQRVEQLLHATAPMYAEQAKQLQELRELQHRAQFDSDIKAIRAAYPDEKAQSVEQLGTSFLALCAHGVAPMVAYEALRADAARKNATPPSMGDVAVGTGGERDYFSREEVNAMTPAQVRRHFDVIRRSQAKW